MIAEISSNLEQIIQFIGAVIASTLVNLIATAKIVRASSKKIEDHITPNGGNSMADKINDLSAWKFVWMELSISPIFMCNGEGHLTWANSALFNLTGTSLIDLSGSAWLKIVHSEDRERVWKEWNFSIQYDSLFDSTFKIVNMQTQKIYKVRCKSAEMGQADNKGTGYIGIYNSVEEVSL